MLYPAELRAHAGKPYKGWWENGRSGGIRTPDILLPKQTRYRAALHSELIRCAFQVVRIIAMGLDVVNEKR